MKKLLLGLMSVLMVLGLSGCETEEKIKTMDTNLESIKKNLILMNKNIEDLNSKTKKVVNLDKKIKQTLCFSQKKYSTFFLASLGNDVSLNGGECKGINLSEMNKKGWRLVQVITGLDSSFGMLFEKE